MRSVGKLALNFKVTRLMSSHRRRAPTDNSADYFFLKIFLLLLADPLLPRSKADGIESRSLDAPCQEEAECKLGDPHSSCLQKMDDWGFCRCLPQYEKLVQPDFSICVKVRQTSTPHPSGSVVVGLSLGLSLLTILLCFTLKLFVKQPRRRHSGFAEQTSAPTIKLDGKELCNRESWSRSSTHSRVYSPGPPLTPTELRKMSLLSSLSVTVPLGQDFTFRSVSPSSSLPASSNLFPPGGEERSEGVERSVTIIPHMGGQESRRRSIADYAFPELHPDTALRKSSRNLLIYTRTSTDSSGRRKSVAVPLLPSSSSNATQRENGTPLVALERKGSVRERKGSVRCRKMSSTMESIQEQDSGRTSRKIRKTSAPPSLLADPSSGGHLASDRVLVPLEVRPAVRKLGVSGGRPDAGSRLSGGGKKVELTVKSGEEEEERCEGNGIPVTESQLPVNLVPPPRQRLQSTSNTTHQARSGGQPRRSASCRRTSKQELLQFLDLAIAH